MITRDEEHFLARCLSSVQAIVDEIIVVDTGSVDRTREIAGLFTDRIYDFKWTDDFSAARNYSLSKATGDWIFSLDADECLSECDYKSFKSLIANIPPVSRAYSFITRNYTNDPNQVGWMANNGRYRFEEAGCGWLPTEKVRLFPNDTEIKYDYAVHEMVEPSLRHQGLIIRKCEIPIHHYGPLFKDNKNAKMRTYYQMGKKKLKATGNDEIALYELAIQAGILGKVNEAIALWQQYIALKADRPEAFVHLATAYFQQQDYRSAMQASKKALELDPAMKEAIYYYSLCEFMIGDIGKTIVQLERLLEKVPEFRPARFLAAAAHICMGDNQKGLGGFKELSQTEMGPDLSATCRELIQKLIDAKRPDCARRLIRNVSGAGIFKMNRNNIRGDPY
jgi:glycosyltransferase involved in cell wall biosynthesis